MKRELNAMLPPMSPDVTGIPHSLSNKRYRDFYPIAERLLTRYRDSEPVQAAVEWMTRWIEDAWMAPDGTKPTDKYRYHVPARAWMRRLSGQGAAPLHLLVHVLAAWLWGRSRKDLYDTSNDLVPLLGSTLLRAVPGADESQRKKTGATSLSKQAIKAAGEKLILGRYSLLGWLVRMENAVRAIKKQDETLAERTRLPLDEPEEPRTND